MKFQIGDKVNIKNTKDKGEIIATLSKDMVMLKTGNIEIPVFIDQLEYPYLDIFLDKKAIKPTNAKVYIDDIKVEKGKKTEIVNEGVHMVFVPSYHSNTFDDIIVKTKVYIQNNTKKEYAFTYNFTAKSNNNFAIESEIKAQQQFYLHDISFEELATSPSFTIVFAQIIQSKNQTIEQQNININLKPKRLFACIDAMHKANNGTFSLVLFAQKPIVETPKPTMPYIDVQKIEEKQKEIKAKANFENLAEIDLHIEKLVENHENIPAGEKLQIQMQYFNKALDHAINAKQQNMVVIHGIGKGVLKNEIFLVLNQTIYVKNYVNEYNTKYGFGATEIYFAY